MDGWHSFDILMRIKHDANTLLPRDQFMDKINLNYSYLWIPKKGIIAKVALISATHILTHYSNLILTEFSTITLFVRPIDSMSLFKIFFLLEDHFLL